MKLLDNVNESDLIFFDIETAKIVQTIEPNTPLWDAWAYKSRYENELNRKTGKEYTPQEYFDEKAALYAVFGKVVAIVAGRINNDTLFTKRYIGKESTLLTEFNNDIQKVLDKNPMAKLCGWASVGFDSPFLMRRMIVHGIRPNLLLDSSGDKPWTVPAVDLKELWKGTGFYPDSLIATAVALGLPSPKSNMDGSQVSEYYYAGKITEIADYCTQDVLTTANIFRKFTYRRLVTLAP